MLECRGGAKQVSKQEAEKLGGRKVEKQEPKLSDGGGWSHRQAGDQAGA